MPDTYRVIITGHDAAGRSCVAGYHVVHEREAGNVNFWMTGTGPDLADGRPGAFPFFPANGRSVFRLFRLPPVDPVMPAEAVAALADRFFAGIGLEAAKVDTSRDPFMHRTPTIDHILVLSGEVSLVLDEGEPVRLRPFDAVVQRGTNHAWVNTGSEPALLMAVMVGGE
ncbi:MAG: cupin domain-containing protein [Ancalomicrobiaceae bacterium]|nr:cupin domain-containing protein [Ancalomicrobiaceae bacterium]